MDLFEMYNMTEFAEFPVLPEELQGIDLEPDFLPPINVEADLPYHYIRIDYGPGEAKQLDELVGRPFTRKGKVSFFYRDIVEGRETRPSVYENDGDDYVLIEFEAVDIGNVIRTFNLPYYSRNDAYKLKDLLRHVNLQLQ